MIADPIQHLLQEHEEIMSLVADLRKVSEDIVIQGENSLPGTLPVFTGFGKMMATKLDLHRHKEDNVFFPTLEAVRGKEGTPMHVMQEEHKKIHA